MGIRIILADEADLVLVGVQTILKDRPEFEVVQTARSAAELLAAGRRWLPDVILFNERLDPQIDLLTLVERLKQASPPSRLILLGNFTDGLLIRDLLAGGVIGCLCTGDDLKDCLNPAISAALNDRPYLSPTASAEYLVAMQQPLGCWQFDGEAQSVLRLLAEGRSPGEIALALRIPLRRVYKVRRKLRRRFGVITNEHLISRAAAEGLISLDR